MARHRRQKVKFKTLFHDPGRPNPPYVEGTRWEIQEHRPPPPFGVGYKTKHRRGPAALAKMRQEQLPQSVYCLLNEPTGPEPDPTGRKLQLEVVEKLRVNTSQGPLLVLCRIGGGDKEDPVSEAGLVVAKLYDPLYYHYNGERDILESADKEYSNEVAAYEHLQQEGVDGRFLPAYYGSYSMEVPVDEQQQQMIAAYAQTETQPETQTQPQSQMQSQLQTVRHVRLILMERVEGVPMTYHLVYSDLSTFPRETRLKAVATTMEAYAQLYFYGLVHGDLAPRNVFLKAEADSDNRGGGDSSKRLIFDRFVDLGQAYVLGSANGAFPRPPACETRPRNPIRLFWAVFESGAANMYYWLPTDLRNTRALQCWMIRRWYGDGRFEPLGGVPEPSEDDMPWDTGRAVQKIQWAGGRTPEAGWVKREDDADEAERRLEELGETRERPSTPTEARTSQAEGNGFW